jgi:WD40 repeat protein
MSSLAKSRIFWLLLSFVILAAPASAQRSAAGPPTEPLLRIETGMHTGTIRRLGVDAIGRFVVTAGDDKSIRVWEMPSGRLFRTIRPPIGVGDEGKLFAVAISPDGETIAAGGWSGYDWDEVHSIYMFDRESGRMKRRIPNIDNVINNLVFSQDGRLLAVSLAGGEGVRVFRSYDGALVGSDKDYAEASYGADFDSAGRLVTSSYDGYVRLYDLPASGGLRLTAKQRTRGGTKAIGASFSPDGTRIAVGFTDGNPVEVFSGTDLTSLYLTDVTDVRSNLGSPAWSTDGRTLFGAGKAYAGANDENIIRIYSQGGRAGTAYKDFYGASGDTIFAMRPLASGGVVYAAADPVLGAIDQNGRSILKLRGQKADFRTGHYQFQVGPGGNSIKFVYEYNSQSPMSFNVMQRKVESVASGTAWRSSTASVAGLELTDWYGNYEPKVNGTRIKLEDYEMSERVAIAPSGQQFVMGTNFWLRLFDRTGKSIWQVDTPGESWMVNITGDARFAVVGFGDGTIRWFRMSDGKEVLSFFLHGDKERWVVWTPSGYYDASPGAEDLIGWHVNNGRDQAADFFPAAQFRDTFYRPDVIALALQTADEAEAVRIANEESGRKRQQETIAQQLPPVVDIISPRDGDEISGPEVTVKYRVRTPSGEPVTNVRALVDGRPSGARQLTRDEKPAADVVREMRVPMPERDSQISLIAENRFTSSVPANLRLRWKAPAAVPAVMSIQPKLYVLAIGVAKYANPKFNLQYSDKDAKDFVAAVESQKGLLYRDVVVKLLTNEMATKDEVLDGLDWIRRETTANDVAMVFFAGHGVNDPNNFYYFCPHNVDPDRLLRTGIAFSDIKNTVSTIAGKALFFVDSCHSGNALGLATKRGPLDINIVINELSSADNGVVVFSAATGSESSYEREDWGNGAFTKAVVEGIRGAAAYGNSGRITYNMMNVYISERVKELTKGQQHPTMISPKTVPDFPIAVRK